MRVVAVLPHYPPQARVGAFLATQELLTGLTVSTDPAEIPTADIVISHAGDNGTAHIAAQAHGVPSVRMVHGHVEDLERRVEGAALVVFNAYSSAHDVGVPHVVVRPPLRAGVQATPGDRVTLINLSWAKGGELFWRLARSVPHVKFFGVRGYGNQTAGAYPNVETVAPTADIASVYARTRVLLMPSERETWGMVGIEALSCGIPVIAHPTPGLRESLGTAGIFVDRADGQGWLDQIERLADPDEWEAASATALAHPIVNDRTVFVEAIESLVRR